MNERPDPRFFFIHVMKTGGTTFQQHVRNNFAPEEVYPHRELDRTPDPFQPYREIQYLLGLGPERREKIRAYLGHFPFVVADLMDLDLVTLTILRDPIDRTISYLKHCKRFQPQHKHQTLEQIYEDPLFYPMLMENHQAKVFSMTPDDRLHSILEAIKIDDRRLQIACANLERVDVLGLHEHYDEFVEEIRSRYGWKFDDMPNQFVGTESWPVSDAFRARIAADNAADIAFYQYARGLHARRRAQSAR